MSGRFDPNAPTVTTLNGRVGDVVFGVEDVDGADRVFAAAVAGKGLVYVGDHSATKLDAGQTWRSQPFNALDPALFDTAVTSWEWVFLGSAAATVTLVASATGADGSFATLSGPTASSAYGSMRMARDRGPTPPATPWLQLTVVNGAVAQSDPMRILLRAEGVPTL